MLIPENSTFVVANLAHYCNMYTYTQSDNKGTDPEGSAVRVWPIKCQDKLWEAMREIESGDDDSAIGDNGKSIGPLQIQKSYYEDAVKKNPSLQLGKYANYTYEDCTGPGSFEYSKAVAESYMKRYATEKRLGHNPTLEDISRIHNGGPNGYKRDATKKYWEKVKKKLGDCY